MTERVKIIDVDQIYNQWNEYATAVNDSDLARWMTLWSENGIQMPPDAPRRIGKDAIRKEMQLLFEHFHTDNMRIDADEVRITDNWAYSHGTYKLDMTPKAGGETLHFSGKFLSIFEKQVDGSWKLALDCFNSNTPPQ